jgi:hypothetical protein
MLMDAEVVFAAAEAESERGDDADPDEEVIGGGERISLGVASSAAHTSSSSPEDVDAAPPKS